MLYAPPLEGRHELDVLEAQTLNTGIQRLKSRLGAASFARLDGFVHNVYHWTPGKMVLIHPADEDIYGNFLRYLGTLDELAESNERAKQETAQRKDELRAAGLGAKELTLLGKVARSYGQVYERLYNFGFPGASAIGPPAAASPSYPMGMGTATAAGTAYPMATAAGPVSPMGSAQPLDPERTRLLAELRRKRLQHAIPVAGAAMTMPGSSAAMAVSSEAAEAARKELERRRDEMDLELISDIEQLKSGLGKTLFPKFDAYLHRLYANAGFEVPVAVGAEKKAKTPSDQQKLPKR